MSDTKKQDESGKHPEGLRIGAVTLHAKDKDGKPMTVKLSGQFYVNGK